LLIESFDVGGTQKAAAPTGNSVSALPSATIVSGKHARRSIRLQVPLSGSLAVQSALFVHVRMPLPLARTRPSQVLSSGPVLHSLSLSPTSTQMPSLQSVLE